MYNLVPPFPQAVKPVSSSLFIESSRREQQIDLFAHSPLVGHRFNGCPAAAPAQPVLLEAAIDLRLDKRPSHYESFSVMTSTQEGAGLKESQ